MHLKLKEVWLELALHSMQIFVCCVCVCVCGGEIVIKHTHYDMRFCVTEFQGRQTAENYDHIHVANLTRGPGNFDTETREKCAM